MSPAGRSGAEKPHGGFFLPPLHPAAEGQGRGTRHLQEEGGVSPKSDGADVESGCQEGAFVEGSTLGCPRPR